MEVFIKKLLHRILKIFDSIYRDGSGRNLRSSVRPFRWEGKLPILIWNLIIYTFIYAFYSKPEVRAIKKGFAFCIVSQIPTAA